MADPFTTTGLLIGGTALSGYSSYEAARRSNSAATRAGESSIVAANRLNRQIDRNATVQTKQLEQAARVEQLKRHNEAAQIEGRLMAIAADRGGVGNGGTMALLLQQAEYDERANARLIDENLANALIRVNTDRNAGILSTRSSLNADLLSLQSRMTNPGLAALTSGAQTFISTGLQIGRYDEETAP